MDLHDESNGGLDTTANSISELWDSAWCSENADRKSTEAETSNDFNTPCTSDALSSCEADSADAGAQQPTRMSDLAIFDKSDGHPEVEDRKIDSSSASERGMKYSDSTSLENCLVDEVCDESVFESSLDISSPIIPIGNEDSPRGDKVGQARAQHSHQQKSYSRHIMVMECLNETRMNRNQYSKRYCVLDNEEMILRVLSDDRSVPKRVVPFQIINDVQNVGCETDDRLMAIKLTLTMPGCSGDRSTANAPSLYLASKHQDVTKWAHFIMQAVLARDNKTAALQSESTIGHRLMSSVVNGKIEKDGWIHLEGKSREHYFVISDGLLAIYATLDDFAACLPKDYIDMKLCNIKKHLVWRNKNLSSLEINTSSQQTYLLTFENLEELEPWYDSFTEAIKKALSDDTNNEILEKIRSNQSNCSCADCGAANPSWASVNFCIVVCGKCAGVHRGLGGNPTSKVKALDLDTTTWTSNTLRLLTETGNEFSNNFWEANLSVESNEKPTPNSSLNQRHAFIIDKYRKKLFADIHPLSDNRDELLQSLRSNVQTDNLYETMRMLFSGDKEFNILDTDLVETAEASEQILQSELLRLNQFNSCTPSSGSQFKAYKRQCSRDPFRKGHILIRSKFSDEVLSTRWCKLSNGRCNFCPDDNECIVNESIDCADDLITVCQSSNEHNLEEVISLYTKEHALELHKFDINTDLSSWLRDLAISCSPIPCAEILSSKSLCAVGLIDIKRRAFGEWNQHWICVTKDRKLLLVDESSESQIIEEFDLRMVTGAVLDVASDDDKDAFCMPLIDLSKRSLEDEDTVTVIYMHSYTNYLTLLWRECIETAATKSGTTLEDQVLTRDKVPLVIAECLKFIDGHAKGVVGLYQNEGSQWKIKFLLKKFRECPQIVHLTKNTWTIHEVTGTLKAFFQDLEEPVMTKHLHENWLEASEQTDDRLKLQQFKWFLDKLPEVNVMVLRRLLIHFDELLRSSEANLISSSGFERPIDMDGLAKIFAPLLFHIPKSSSHPDSPDFCRAIKVIKSLMKNYVSLFDIGAEDIAKEQKLSEYTDIINNLQADWKRKQSADLDNIAKESFRLPVTVEFNGEEDETFLDIHTDTNAQDVLNFLIEKKKISSSESLAVFEVLITNEVERYLLPNEPIYNLVMKWRILSNYSSSAHLRIKENYILRNMDLNHQSSDCLKSTVNYVKVSLVKKSIFQNLGSIVKHQLVLKNEMLTLNKYLRKSAKTTWNIHNITFYHGVEKRHKLPSKWGMTLVEIPTKPTKSDSDHPGIPFIRIVCFDTHDELYSWLRAVSCVKSPDCKVFSEICQEMNKPVSDSNSTSTRL